MSKWWEQGGKEVEPRIRKKAMPLKLRLFIRYRIPHGIRHTILRPAFWLGLTLGFPLEHLLWEKLWPFDMVTKWLGL